MYWKGSERKRLWPHLRYYHSFFMGGLRETIKIPQNSYSPGRDMNRVFPQYEVVILLIRK
jgi:hypothetical protein